MSDVKAELVDTRAWVRTFVVVVVLVKVFVSIFSQVPNVTSC